MFQDKFVEKDDLDILVNDLCHSKEPATGKYLLSEWL